MHELNDVSQRCWLDRRVIALMAVTSGIVLGAAIGQERWVYAFAIVAIPLVLVWPVQAALGMFALFVPFDSIPLIAKDEGSRGGMPITWFVGAAAAIILLATGLLRGLERPPRAAFWWTLFIAWSGVTSIWALEPEVALQRLPTAFSLLVLYIAAVSLRISEKEFSWVVVAAIAGGCASAAYACFQFYHGTFYQPASVRTSLEGTDPNQFGAALTLPISLAIGALISFRSWPRRVSVLIAIAMMVFAVFLTMSRGSAVALAVVVFIYLTRIQKKWSFLIPVSLLSVLLLAVPETFFVRFQRAAQTGGAGRLDIWTVALAAIRHYCVVGAGLNNFPVAYSRFAGFAPVFRGTARGAHNIFLGTWVEVGIIGLLLLLNAFRSQLRAAGKAFTELPDATLVSCRAACWGMLTAGFFLDILWRKAFWLSWILLAMAVRVRQKVEVAE